QDLTVQASSVKLGNVGATTGLGAVTDTSDTKLTGSTYDASSFDFGALVLANDATIDASGDITIASVDGATNGGQDLTLEGASVSLGDVGDSKRLGALTDTTATTLTGSNYDAVSFDFGALTLTDSASLNATGAITIASVDGTTNGGQDLTLKGSSVSLGDVGDNKSLGSLTDTSATTLTGSSYDAAAMTFGALTLTSNTSLDASGDITIASVDGTTAGAQALSLQASSVKLGSVGATTSLGAFTDDATTKLTGSTYDASSIDFEGDITLTAATTTFDTSSAAGDITVAGTISGTTNGGQSLVLIAGPGTGDASANGNISLQDVGTSKKKLDNLTVSGNNFSAATVWLAGDFTSQLIGNQVFTADTLNAGGNVNSTVGGDATGHIVANGDVTITAGDITGSTVVAGGDVNAKANSVTTSTFSGKNITITADTVNATADAVDKVEINSETIDGSYSGDTVSLTASQNIDATIKATDVDVNAPRGSVDGTWTNLDLTSAGTVEVNGEPHVGNFVNGQQLVVEGFVLPAGAVVTANGQLVLPPGMVIGLLSPGGDSKPKLILVHSVQDLGSLLEAGYMAIIIDLSGHKKDDKIQLASN
ncbi:MAG TPA: hypothetical protein VGG24_09240, partial [Paraburkholderia sp.]